MENDKQEQFFRALAKAYVENDGEALINEHKNIKDKNSRLRRFKRRLALLPLAASLIVLAFVYRHFYYAPPPINATHVDMNALNNGVAFVRACLPADYRVTGVDYDNEMAVMDIESSRKNPIVLTMMPYAEFETAAFTTLSINGETAYGLVRNDFSVLKYQKDGMVYTLTCPYDYQDLILLSEKIL